MRSVQVVAASLIKNGKNWREVIKHFYIKKGLALYVRRNRPDRRNVEQQSSAQISFLKMYYEYVVKCKQQIFQKMKKMYGI